MAHVEKFKRNDLVPVLKEGFRDSKRYRNDVDETMTEYNYTFGCQTWEEVKSKALERESKIMDGKIDKRSRPLFSWVVTYPKGRTSVRERDFFEGVRDYMSDLYGEANVMAVCVHMDETTPHCHCYIVPEAESRNTGRTTVSTASLLDKKHLQRFHKDFDEYMYERFGERNLIERAEEDKAEENVSMLELKRRTKKAEIKELETKEQELTKSVSHLEITKQNLVNELERSKAQIDAKVSDYQQKKVEELKQYLERSQTLIKAEISDYRDKRVKEVEKELEPLEARKKRMENDIEEMKKGWGDKFEKFAEYQYWSEKADKAKQAFERFTQWMSDWQLFKVKKEHESYHAQREKNDDWDMDF